MGDGNVGGLIVIIILVVFMALPFLDGLNEHYQSWVEKKFKDWKRKHIK